MQRVHFHLKDRKNNPIGTFTAFGKSKRHATTRGRRVLKNIAEGFVDSSGEFHPIRASADYDSRRTGEGKRGRASAHRARHKRARKRARRQSIS